MENGLGGAAGVEVLPGNYKIQFSYLKSLGFSQSVEGEISFSTEAGKIIISVCSGSESAGCEWPSILSASIPSVLLVQEVNAVQIGTDIACQ